MMTNKEIQNRKRELALQALVLKIKTIVDDFLENYYPHSSGKPRKTTKAFLETRIIEKID